MKTKKSFYVILQLDKYYTLLIRREKKKTNLIFSAVSKRLITINHLFTICPNIFLRKYK